MHKALLHREEAVRRRGGAFRLWDG